MAAGGLLVAAVLMVEWLVGGREPVRAIADTSSSSVLQAVVIGAQPAGVIVDPLSHAVYVANAGDGVVAEVEADGGRVVGSVPVGGHPSTLTLDPGAHRLFIADPERNVVSVLDTDALSLVAELSTGGPLGSSSHGLAVDPTRHVLYVASAAPGDTLSPSSYILNTITAFDGLSGAQLRQFPARSGLGNDAASSVVFDAASNLLYVATSGVESNEIDEISQGDPDVGRPRPIGLGSTSSPQAMALDPGSQRMLVGNTWPGGLEMIDLSTNPTLVPSSESTYLAFSIADDESEGVFYLVRSVGDARSRPSQDQQERTVTEVAADTGRVLGDLPLTGDLQDVAVDSATHVVYVTDAVAGQLWTLAGMGYVGNPKGGEA